MPSPQGSPYQPAGRQAGRQAGAKVKGKHGLGSHLGQALDLCQQLALLLRLLAGCVPQLVQAALMLVQQDICRAVQVAACLLLCFPQSTDPISARTPTPADGPPKSNDTRTTCNALTADEPCTRFGWV